VLLDVGADFGLYCWREEVALYGGDASRWLGGDDVYTDDTAVGLSAVNGDLGPRAGRISLAGVSPVDQRLRRESSYEIYHRVARFEEFVFLVDLSVWI
jgi:hypothetical protein